MPQAPKLLQRLQMQALLQELPSPGTQENERVHGEITEGNRRDKE